MMYREVSMSWVGSITTTLTDVTLAGKKSEGKVTTAVHVLSTSFDVAVMEYSS
jgi:hypothetical protein